MSKYYLITLKNARTYEARNVRVNGHPLVGLHTLVAPGRLECVVLPAAASGGLGSFKSLVGIFTEFDIVDPAVPDRRCTLRGRVRSATASPGGAVPANRPTETITIHWEEIKWQFPPLPSSRHS
jgi:hypothetical protein